MSTPRAIMVSATSTMFSGMRFISVGLLAMNQKSLGSRKYWKRLALR